MIQKFYVSSAIVRIIICSSASSGDIRMMILYLFSHGFSRMYTDILWKHYRGVL